MLLQHTYEACEAAAVLIQSRIIRNDDECMPGMQDTGGLHQRIDHERSRWQHRTDQIVKDVAHNRIRDFVGHPSGRILIQRANGVPAAVPARKVQ